ncbi:hypothetical protein EUAN_19940 [Andreesenia angusta]|uniref:Uncharacterized protein n=1 Tax=Andreesenia angusta TaxID=39480 RepID=A0A1S1V5B3_9FIRM|nr:hypothetical protein [Andreesenia angusta]OHW61674.1 hypothetical protein EUAN_19940 [Andreesenia angusta]
MTKSAIGSFAIIFGGICLSLELYALKFIQSLEFNTGSANLYPLDYATEAPMSIALIISISIIIYGISLSRSKSDSKK